MSATLSDLNPLLVYLSKATVKQLAFLMDPMTGFIRQKEILVGTAL